MDRGRPADGLFVTVSADGKADFSTVQGALDFADDNLSETHTIYVRNGDYEELVYARNKSHLRIVGESTYASAVSVLALALGRCALGYLLTVRLGLGVPGLWIALAMEWLLRAAAFRVRAKKLIKTNQEAPA